MRLLRRRLSDESFRRLPRDQRPSPALETAYLRLVRHETESLPSPVAGSHSGLDGCPTRPAGKQLFHLKGRL